MFLLICSFVVVCILLYLYSTWTFGYWKAKGVPYLEPTPLFGNIKEAILLRRPLGHVHQDIYGAFEGESMVGMYQLRRPTLMVRSPELVGRLLVKDFGYLEDRGLHYDEKREPLTAHLVNLTGHKWRALRSLLTPAFSSGKLKAMIPLLNESVRQLLAYIQNESAQNTNGEIEIREIMCRFTTDVIGSIGFGLQFCAMAAPTSKFREMGRKAMAGSAMSAWAKACRAFFPALFTLLRMRTFPEEVDVFFRDVVARTLEFRRTTGTWRNDFIQLMMDQKSTNRNDHQLELTDNLIAAQAFVFFVAGFETSSMTLAYCLYELSRRRDIQTKAFDEIETIRRKHGDITCEAIGEMKYIENILYETMRMYPPINFLYRVCTKKYTLEDTEVTLDPGVAILIPIYAIHHDPLHFHEPGQFNPDRFTEKDYLKSYMYLPFGKGPRICIGMRFAMLEMKLALVSIIQNFMISSTFRSEKGIIFDPKSFVMAPKDGIWLQLISRK